MENVPTVTKNSNRQSSEEPLEMNNREGGNESDPGIWNFPYTMLKKDWSLSCLDLSSISYPVL